MAQPKKTNRMSGTKGGPSIRYSIGLMENSTTN